MSDYNDYVSAIDNHNVANGDESWFSRKIDATGELVSDVGEALTKGTVGAVVAGVDSILNSGIAVANVFGADIDPISTYDVLGRIDSSLGDYYKAHEQGIEVAGFALGMFVPGTAGVKAMQAAKAGILGTNMAKSSGLMITLTKDYAQIAKAEIASGTSPFNILNKSTLQALAQGAGSATLDMAAFNTAVTATMFKSPILDQESIGDLFMNDVKDTILFGGIGGVFKGFQIYGQLTKAGKTADILTYPYRAIEEAPKNADPQLKILNYYHDKFSFPEAMGPLPDISTATGLTEQQGLELITKERAKTNTRLDELIRQNFNEFAGGDTKIGNKLFETFQNAKSFEEVTNGLLNAKTVGRIGKNETLATDEVFYADHGIKTEDFTDLVRNKEWDKLLVGKEKTTGQGYRVIGDMGELKVTSADTTAAKMFTTREAFADGYDIVRNPNGSLSINPESKIIQRTDVRPSQQSRIIDLETNNIVDKALPNIADLSTPAKPVLVRGDTVFYGDNQIRIGKSEVFDPRKGSYLDSQARYIWAQDATIKWDSTKIGAMDLPLLERLYTDDAKLKTETSVYLKTDAGLTLAPRGQALLGYIENVKAKLAQEMNGMSIEEMALRLNTPEKWLTEGAGDSSKIKPGYDVTQPRFAKLTMTGDNSMYPMLNANNHTGAIEYARQLSMVKERNMQNWMNFAKDENNSFPDDPNWLDPGRTPTREGAGASLFGFANGNFGSAGGWAQITGSATYKLMLTRKTATKEVLDLAIGSIRSGVKGEEATAEAALINNTLLRSPEAYVFHPDGSNTLVLRKDVKEILNNNFEPEDFIDIKNESVADFYRAHINLNGNRATHIHNMKGSAGVGDDFDPNVLYPIPVDTTKLKHFVFVEPRAPVTLGDKKRVIAAKDEATLQKLIGQVDQNEFKVTTKQEKEDWHKAVGDYEYSLGLNDSMVDSTLKREGKLSQHFPTIDEGFFERVNDWHSRQEETLTHSMVYHRYSDSFEELKHLGERYTNIATSQFRSLTEKLEQSVKDPYNDIIRTSLNISRSSEYQPWVNFNNFIKDAIEKPINKLKDVFAKAKDIDQDFVDKVNNISKDMGQGNVFVNTTQALVANGNIPNKPWLQDFIGKTNALLSTTLLQWDTFNAINNIASTSIIAAPEMNKLIEAIKKGNPDIAGKLSGLMEVKMPDGSGISLPTTRKLLFNATQNFMQQNEATAALVKRYQENGAINTLTQEMRQMLQDNSLDFKIATEKDAKSGLAKVTEFGRKWTGNNLAEQYTRFVSADMARQIGDLGEQAGIITRKESDELIQLFTNRTQGNYLYSQRPIVFQGVVGQAIGLFQTYQFNLMQQLFKHVADGDNKAIAMLAGLQSSIYGMQGLPAFSFLNNHIVGNANGNTQHKDLYTASYSTFGKSLGDWIMYGAGSNALGLVDPSMRFNLYSRGDINPRQLTVLPTTLADIPIVNASTKFIGNLFNAFGKVTNGADILPTISQAIEHNGVSRPLAGLAQIAQGYTSTNSGSLLTTSQDFWNIATLTRVGGAKPFDESLALDAMYRINAYKAKDTQQIQDLGSAVRTTVIAGGHPTGEQISKFAAEYVKAGGRIEGFNKYMSNMILTANRSQVNAISQNLQNPFAKQVQIIMGGQPLTDFLGTPVATPP